MLKDYDKAWAKYQNNLKLMPIPIVSWGIADDYTLEYDRFNKIQKRWSDKTNFLEIASQTKREIIVTDVNFKIVFASRNMVTLNGYQQREVLGKSPSMFQGVDTCEKSRHAIKTAIDQLKPFKEVLLNYTKEGKTYYCEIEAYPQFCKKGFFLNYIALERIAS
jgi:PAS domain S-box-containing protein